MITAAFVLFASMSSANERGGDIEQRVINKETRKVRRVEPGDLVVSASLDRGEVRVTVARERKCLVDTVEVRTVERFRSHPDALPVGLAVGGVGILGLLGAGAATMVAPQQPSIDDEFSRGEVSREAVYGIAATVGLLGMVGVGGGVAAAVLGREEILGQEVKNKVIATRAKWVCPPEPVSSATVQLLVWNKDEPLEGDLTDDMMIFDVADDRLDLPPVGTPWATIEVMVSEEKISTAWDPPAGAFASKLVTDGDIAELAKFHARFPDAKEWAQLEWRYQQLLAAKVATDQAAHDREAEERRHRGQDLLRQARAEAAQREFVNAIAKVNEAESLGADVNPDRTRIEDAATAIGRAHLARALALAKAGQVTAANVQAEAARGLGLERPEELDRIIEQRRSSIGWHNVPWGTTCMATIDQLKQDGMPFRQQTGISKAFQAPFAFFGGSVTSTCSDKEYPADTEVWGATMDGIDTEVVCVSGNFAGVSHTVDPTWHDAEHATILRAAGSAQAIMRAGGTCLMNIASNCSIKVARYTNKDGAMRFGRFPRGYVNGNGDNDFIYSMFYVDYAKELEAELKGCKVERNREKKEKIKSKRNRVDSLMR